MANRRRLGNALLGASQGLGGIVDALARQAQAQKQAMLQRQGADYEQRLAIELADRKSKADQLLQGLRNPEQFNRLADAGVQDLNGVPTSKLGISSDQAIGGAAGDIAKIDKLEALPTDLDIEGSMQGKPGFPQKDPRPIEQLMAQRNAREQSIKDAASPIKRSRIGAEGVTEEFYANPYSAEGMAPVRTERTGMEEGTRKGAIAIGEAPGQITAGNQIEAGTRNEKVRTAGAIAGTQQAAQTAGEGARLRQAQEIAASDPAIASMAEAALKDPVLLEKASPRERKYIIDAMGAERYRGQAVKNSVQMQKTALEAVDQMLAHPGFGSAVGMKGLSSGFGVMSEPLAGSSASDFSLIFNQFKAAVALPNLRYMQGLGHMSDREFMTVASASSQLDRARSEPEFKQELLKTRQALLTSLAANGDAAAVTATPTDPAALVEQARQIRQMRRSR